MNFGVFVSCYKMEEISIFKKNNALFKNFTGSVKLYLILNPAIVKDFNASVFEGVDLHVISGIPDMISPYDEGSYRHAGNLNTLIELYGVEHEHILLCDPDIIFTSLNVFQLLAKQHSQGYAVIGSNWDKTIPSKWQDFPAPHFVSVKLENFHPSIIDLRPNLEKSFNKRQLGKRYKNLIIANNKPVFRKLNGFLNFGLLVLKKNLSTDTGFYLRQLCLSHKMGIKFIVNEVNYYNLIDLERIKKGFNRLIRNWAPYFFGFIPKVAEYRSALLKDHFWIYKLTRPEELFLDDHLIALHFRSVRVLNQQSTKGIGANQEFINENIDFLSLKPRRYIRNPKFQEVMDG